MHPAWHVNDINHLIFEHLEPIDLAQLARTSQAFFHIATDELWNTIGSFEALVCCLVPEFGDRPLQKEDLRRLDLYTSKVRHIKLDAHRNSPAIRLPSAFTFTQTKKGGTERRSKKTWKELWGEIAEIRPPSELFCNLRYLHINNVIEELLMPLIGISGLHLTKIYIKYFQERQADSVIRRILDGFQDTPNLTYLFVRDGESGLVPGKLIQQAPLKHLRLDRRKYFGYPVSNHHDEIPILHDILQKSTIEHLTIGLSNDWYTPEIQALGKKYLPNLKTLWLNLSDCTPQWRCKACFHSGVPSWTCKCLGVLDYQKPNDSAHSLGRSPNTFFEGLDNPELTLLHIKFPRVINGRMLLELVFAANRSCRLRSLAELTLTGGESHRCGGDFPMISNAELRMATEMLLPLPKLKLLRLSVATTFLDVLDLKVYQSIAKGLPALETLWLGHAGFSGCSQYTGPKCHEHVPLSHLAALCQMLPNLVDVTVGAAIPEPLGTAPCPEHECLGVKSLRIQRWTHSKELFLSMQMYFPNSYQAKNGLCCVE